jgi:hypothetical protein
VWDRIETNEFANVVVKAVAMLFPQDPPMLVQRAYPQMVDIGADLSPSWIS